MRRLAAPILIALIAGACSRGADEEAARRLAGPDAGDRAEAAPFDLERPLSALALDADGVARRLGSFEWTAGIEWTFSREGEDAQRVRAVERHRVRQSATGDFDVSAEIDPGLGPGSDSGKDVIRAGGMTYARAKYAPWRERPTDRGRDARLSRDESFSAPAAVLRLCGAVAATPAGLRSSGSAVFGGRMAGTSPPSPFTCADSSTVARTLGSPLTAKAAASRTRSGAPL